MDRCVKGWDRKRMGVGDEGVEGDGVVGRFLGEGVPLGEIDGVDRRLGGEKRWEDEVVRQWRARHGNNEVMRHEQ